MWNVLFHISIQRTPFIKRTCFSPVCSRMCTFMLPEVEKHFKQHWHSKALIPVWVFICAVRVLLTAKALKHCLHLKGFSWVWIRMWRTRSLGFLNSLVQYGQPCQRTPFSSLIEPGEERKKWSGWPVSSVRHLTDSESFFYKITNELTDDNNNNVKDKTI